MAELVAADWAAALAPVEAELRSVLEFLAAEVAAGHPVLPAPSNVLRAFRRPLADVRVLIVGQDPYPTPGHPIGLSFAVDGHTRPIPRSLANIYKELEADLGLPARIHGDLSRWAEQGVLLLNRVLTVRAGAAGSHRGKGGNPSRRRPSPPLPGGALPTAALCPWWPSCGARMPRASGPCWGTHPCWPAPIPARCQPRADSSVPGRSAKPTKPSGRMGSAPVDWELPPVS